MTERKEWTYEQYLHALFDKLWEERKDQWQEAFRRKPMDIVERLRTCNTMFSYYDTPEIQEEAAKEIERLREENEAFRKKLIEMLGFEPVVDYPLKGDE